MKKVLVEYETSDGRRYTQTMYVEEFRSFFNMISITFISSANVICRSHNILIKIMVKYQLFITALCKFFHNFAGVIADAR